MICLNGHKSSTLAIDVSNATLFYSGLGSVIKTDELNVYETRF